jgi:hypothetical protein
MLDSNKTEKGMRPVKLANIPQELRPYKQWVAWKAVPTGNGKVTKVPINPNTGGNAATNNPASWGSFQDAVSYYEQHKGDGIAGIGFVFTEVDRFCGIDLDNCINPETLEMRDWASVILGEVNSYSEISPSGTGVKVFCKGSLPGHGRNFGQIEIYDTGRYFTLTGEIFGECPKSIEDRSAEVTKLYNDLSNQEPEVKAQVKAVENSLGEINIDSLPIAYGTKKLIKEGEEQGSRSEAIMSVVNALVGARLSEAEIFTIFENYPIGEKYLEKGSSRERWLKSHIDKAKGFVKPGEKQREVLASDTETSLIFPSHVMTGTAGQFAEVYGANLETPKEFLFLSYLTCLGSVLSRRLTLASEIEPQPRLYTLLLGQSADERKSTALKIVIDHFKDAVDQFDVCWGVGSAEGLQKRLENGKDGLLLSLDEFKQFVAKCKIQSSVLLPCVNTLFESNRYESRTKTTNINLTEAYLSLLAASTVQTYERTWDSSFTDIGFNNRLFLVPGTALRKHSFPEKISDLDKLNLKRKLEEIIHHVGGHTELDITTSAKRLYHRWYMDGERSIHAKRLDTYALRLMSLLAVNDLKGEVDEETVRKVIDLCNWQLEVRKLHDPIDADNKIAKIEEKIRRQLKTGPMKERKLKQRVNAHRSGLWAFDTAKKNLERGKEIAWDKKTKKWRLT